MSSSCWQLQALLIKNFLLLKRNKCSTFAEIIFPVFLMIILVLVRNVFKAERKEFLVEEISDENYFTNQSSFYINHQSLSQVGVDQWNSTIFNVEQLILKGFEYSASAKIVTQNFLDASNINVKDNLKVRGLFSTCNGAEDVRLIGIVGNMGEKIKEKLEQYLTNSIYDQVFLKATRTELEFKFYDSVSNLEDYIKNDNYGRTKDYPQLCFAVQLNKNNLNNQYEASLHYIDLKTNNEEPDVPSGMMKPISEFQLGPDMDSFVKYRNNGYNYILKIIYDTILEDNGIDKTIDFAMAPMKYDDYDYDIFSKFIGYIIPSFTMIAYMCPLCLNVYRMVNDKETKAKEGMKIMGLNEGTYFLSYFIQFFLFNLIHSILNGGIIHKMFNHVPFIYLFATFLLFGLDIFALAFFFQSFIDKTRVALILSILIYYVMSFLYIAISDEAVKKGIKMICSIFPPVALELGVILMGKFQSALKDFKAEDAGKTYMNYTINGMFLMMFLDFLLFLFLGYYLQNIISHDFGIARPFYFLCTKNYWCKTKKQKTNAAHNQNESNVDFINNNNNSSQPIMKPKLEDDKLIVKENENKQNFQSEDIYKNKNSVTDVFKLVNIIKIFGDNKKAVDGVNLNLYKDEIFALLGHNGAGKSTLISILSGLYEATSGEAYYNGQNILDDVNMDIFHRILGICPQHDVLFGDLTLKEHLQMFCHFKGVPSNKIDEEIKKTCNDFHISDIQEILAKNLSAGQRRKLSIAIALIGGSKVIFLDEPSSGMDITSRRNLWEILKRCTDDKIIILTTHYMEEASVLGNRIGIISDGRMKCVGSPLFLIERFGKFMSVNITKEEDANNSAIIDFFKERVSNVQYEVLSEEIMFRIPKENYACTTMSEVGSNNVIEVKKANSSKFSFEKFFSDLDSNIKELKIKSYSAAMPTLEDVFLNVASSDIQKEQMKNNVQASENDKILFEENFYSNYSMCQKFVIDLSIALKKRFYQVIRDLKTFVLELLCPIVLVMIGLAVTKINFIGDSDPIYPILDQVFDAPIKIYYTSPNGIDTPPSLIKEDDGKIATFIKLDIENDKLWESGLEFMKKLFKEKVPKCYASFLYKGLNNDENSYQFIEIISTEMRESNSVFTPFFLNRLVNEILYKEKGKTEGIKVNYYHKGFPLVPEVKEKISQGKNNMLALFASVAFSLIPANFVTIIVKERVNNSKHLMKVSGITLPSYWLSNYIFEIVKYYFEGGIIMLMILAFDYMPKYFYLVYLLYGPAMVSFTYMVSFLFESESGSQNGLILINLLFGSLATTVCVALRSADSVANVGKFLSFIFRFIPSFCLGYSFSVLLSAKMFLYLETPVEKYLTIKDSDILKFKFIGGDLFYMAIEAVLCLVILAIIERCSYSMKVPPRGKISNPSKHNDSMVMKEIDRAQYSLCTDKVEDPDNKNEYSVRVQNISKTFTKPGKMCNPEKVEAIKNLNFCIEYGECFGLLGINGAGKTTMFKCITQETSQTNGAIFINGIDTSTNFEKVHDKFGYCPQFDAIFEYMTVYENLEFYAKIKGVSSEKIQKMIKAMIDQMSLTQYTNKISGNLSGGNKRKLSVAISMICNPPIILLDEPSTGMDPEARRFMWAVIHKISSRNKQSSVIMTTHSMDEAETLCRRMGIMVKGEFACLGTAQHIKDKYGYGFEIDIRIMPLSEKELTTMLSSTSYDKNTGVNMDNINQILIDLKLPNYINELNEVRIGRKILRDVLTGTGNITVSTICSWCHYVCSAMKVIKQVNSYFETIILTEFIENNFLFKIKKTPTSRSIGFLFGLIEKIKEECNVTEYSIQPTSLEQIFNMFASQEEEAEEREKAVDKKVEIEINDDILSNLIFK